MKGKPLTVQWNFNIMNLLRLIMMDMVITRIQIDAMFEGTRIDIFG